MRRVVIVAALYAGNAIAQDLSVVAITAPQSGCALSTAENVTVRLFNYGQTLPAGSQFNIAYAVNDGIPVSQAVQLGSNLLAHGSLVHTFAVPANLGAAGDYTFAATVSLSGDVNPANDGYTGHTVTNWAPSAGGGVTGAAGPTLAGSVALSGHAGAVVEWQQSDDGGQRWRRLANGGTTQNFAMLREHTAFRALVRNGPCAPALSSAHLVLSSDPLFYNGYEP